MNVNIHIHGAAVAALERAERPSAAGPDRPASEPLDELVAQMGDQIQRFPGRGVDGFFSHFIISLRFKQGPLAGQIVSLTMPPAIQTVARSEPFIYRGPHAKHRAALALPPRCTLKDAIEESDFLERPAEYFVEGRETVWMQILNLDARMDTEVGKIRIILGETLKREHPEIFAPSLGVATALGKTGFPARLFFNPCALVETPFGAFRAIHGTLSYGRITGFPDWDWLPLDAVAVDLSPYYRRWAVERILTSIEALEDEDYAFREAYGEPLYPELMDLKKDEGRTAVDREGYSEPEDTENWPLYEPGRTWCDPNESPVEVWQCWDNIRGTLTIIANRKVVLARGVAPTPRRLDPFVGNPAVPVPNRVYGDSTLNWTGDLANRRTRFSRARMDETLLGIFGLFVRREGMVIGGTERLIRPGGDFVIRQSADPNRPLKADFDFFQRPPMNPDSIREDMAAETEGQVTCAADVLNMGGEATGKSRDVPATEIQQRVLQGSGRIQLENLFKQASVVGPMLEKTWQLLRQNLTQKRVVRYLDPQGEDQERAVDLLDLEEDVDFRLGGGVYELTRQDRQQEISGWIGLAKTEVFAPYLNPRPILEAWAKTGNYKGYRKFFKQDQEVQSEQSAEEMNELTQQLAGKAASGGGCNGDMAGQLGDIFGALGGGPEAAAIAPGPSR